MGRFRLATNAGTPARRLRRLCEAALLLAVGDTLQREHPANPGGGIMIAARLYKRRTATLELSELHGNYNAIQRVLD